MLSILSMTWSLNYYLLVNSTIYVEHTVKDMVSELLPFGTVHYLVNLINNIIVLYYIIVYYNHIIS